MHTIKLLCFLVFAGGCGRVTGTPPDATPDMPDASPATPSGGRELAPAAGRVTGGAWNVDIHLGALTTSASRGGPLTVRGDSPIHP